MANSYNAGGNYFDIDTSTNVAGLIALKSGAPDATDTVYISEGATATIEQNATFFEWYVGDNQAGTAVVKTGHVLIDAVAAAANVTLTLASNAVHGGMRGEGSTSSLTMTGDATYLAKIFCTNTDKVTNFYMKLCMITMSFAEVEHMNIWYMAAAYDIQDSVFRDCKYTLRFSDAWGAVKPASLNGTSFIGCVGSIYDVTTNTPVGWGDFFATNRIICTGNADGNSMFDTRFGQSAGITRYIYYREKATPITDEDLVPGAGGGGGGASFGPALKAGLQT